MQHFYNLWQYAFICLQNNPKSYRQILMKFSGNVNNGIKSKVKVGVLRPVKQPGSYWDRSSALPLVGLEPTEVSVYDLDAKLD